MNIKTLVCSVIWMLLASGIAVQSQPYYVSPSGKDDHPGTLEKPFATLARAQQAVRQHPGSVFLRGGTHYLSKPLTFTAEDSGLPNAPIVWQAYPQETAVISGGLRLEGLVWEAFTNGIYRARVAEGFHTEEMFANGQRQRLARYPNFDTSAQYFDGFAADAISRARAAKWMDPTGGYFHAMHPALWGDFTWRITGKDEKGEVKLEGGWQNNRGGAVHDSIRFVENIFEELDAPGEWYLDGKQHLLYFYPPEGLDLRTAVIEATQLRSLVEFRGSESRPVKFVKLRGLVFRHAARTVMDTREPLMRSDWAIYRGGALFLEGAEDCLLEELFLDQVGGNAIFVNGYNRRLTVRGCHVARAGANGICLVGDPKAARSPLYHYEQVQPLESLDLTPGPRNTNYPSECLIEDCLIHLTGRVEKQTAGVHLQLAQDITVRHCSIYDMPRAGINIGDGCWGGHVIEFCDVFDTVKETGDHGSFNSWGRDRFWRPRISEVNEWVKKIPGLPFLDAVKPTVLRNNRWRCDHGWDIDLDDGSSHYVLTNNLCLRGGIKNREGFRRVVENNIMVGSGFHPHVWYEQGEDVFRHNIVWSDYQPALMHRPPWGRELDYNLLHREGVRGISPAEGLRKQSGRDLHSVVADAQFVDPGIGNYQVKDSSPALALGFVNFSMDSFGVQHPKLKAMARTPAFPGAKKEAGPSGKRDGSVHAWLGARVRNVRDGGEMSALGLPRVSGVLIVDLERESPLAKAGMRANDVVVSLNGAACVDFEALQREVPALAPFQSVSVGIFRQQKMQVMRVVH